MSSNLYKQFARYYVNSHYTQYTDHIIDLFPQLEERYQLPQTGRLLDLACGAGQFCLAMARTGWEVSGLDQSREMLSFGITAAQNEARSIDFREGDMRSLPWKNTFDLVTCWFDSLNYMLTAEDLRAAFQSVFSALKPGGYFVFDMNTLYGLLVSWQAFSTTIQTETPNLIEIHRNSCNHELGTATLHLTLFEREEGKQSWMRVDEFHAERAYPVDDLCKWLNAIGFKVADVLGSIREFSIPRKDSPRVWIIAQKPTSGVV
ncbi:MAG: class I SAM-dependent methyltransferase [Anaerolineaceae bacterium]|nr:class I SAM-dependent methyltransferase [Anaerolineaceae bacterium]